MLNTFSSLVILFLLVIQSFAAGPYDHVDKQVLAMTDLNENEIFQLTHQLTNPFSKQEEKVRAVFRWITANIEYDTGILKNKNRRARTFQEVLARKKDICSGYAMLFKAMMNNTGIECEIINGHSKGYQYELVDLFNEKNAHAWNAVKLNDEWYLIDATWGSGYIEDNRFIRSFNDYYFFTPAEELIQTHYPDERRWQLLDKKISKEEFADFVYLKPAYFKYNIRVLSHPNYKIDVENSLQVKVFAPVDILVEARIYYGENPLDQNFVFAQRNKDIIEINAGFTDADSYFLRLFAQRKEQSTPYDWVLDYRVITHKVAENAIGFPKKYVAFEEFNVYLISPLTKFLAPGSEVEFKLRADKCEKVALIQGESFTFFNKNNDIFSGKFTIPKGKFFIAASPPGSNQFSYLLEYDGWK
jgi:hypothetical protein